LIRHVPVGHCLFLPSLLASTIILRSQSRLVSRLVRARVKIGLANLACNFTPAGLATGKQRRRDRAAQLPHLRSRKTQLPRLPIKSKSATINLSQPLKSCSTRVLRGVRLVKATDFGCEHLLYQTIAHPHQLLKTSIKLSGSKTMSSSDVPVARRSPTRLVALSAPSRPFPYPLLSSITSLEVNLLTERKATQIIQMLDRLSPQCRSRPAPRRQ
jgi:hypothetical protein